MKSRLISRSGVWVSTVGLGGFELGPETAKEPDVDRAVLVIETALAEGINWLDTSENYLETRNESLIGTALGMIRSEFLVASKVAPSSLSERPCRRETAPPNTPKMARKLSKTTRSLRSRWIKLEFFAQKSFSPTAC